MTETPVRDRVIQALWPAATDPHTSVWAIVDCARDERIYPALRTSGLDYRCLFSGRMSPAFEAAAPHLIELAPSYRFTSRLIEMVFGPISTDLLEDESGQDLIEFSFDGTTLDERRIGLLTDDSVGGLTPA